MVSLSTPQHLWLTLMRSSVIKSCMNTKSTMLRYDVPTFILYPFSLRQASRGFCLSVTSRILKYFRQTSKWICFLVSVLDWLILLCDSVSGYDRFDFVWFEKPITSITSRLCMCAQECLLTRYLDQVSGLVYWFWLLLQNHCNFIHLAVFDWLHKIRVLSQSLNNIIDYSLCLIVAELYVQVKDSVQGQWEYLQDFNFSNLVIKLGWMIVVW